MPIAINTLCSYTYGNSHYPQTSRCKQFLPMQLLLVTVLHRRVYQHSYTMPHMCYTCTTSAGTCTGNYGTLAFDNITLHLAYSVLKVHGPFPFSDLTIMVGG